MSAELLERIRTAHAGITATLVAAPPGRPWLALAIPIAPMAAITLRAMLVANAELPVGALALVETTVVVRQTLPLEGLLLAQLDQAAHALTALAMQLRAAATDDGAPFAYLYR